MFEWNEECYLYQRQNNMDAGGQHIDERRWIGVSVSKLKTGAGGEDWTALARTNGDRESVRRQWTGTPTASGAGGEERHGHW